MRGRGANSCKVYVPEMSLFSDHFAWQLQASYASAGLFRGRRSTFEASTSQSLKRIGILTSSVWSTSHF